MGCGDYKGDRNSSENHSHWYQVIFNLTASVSYDISILRVYKCNQDPGCITRDCKTFVDYLRYIGSRWNIFCENTNQVETMMGYLGFQNATRKRFPITKAPGKWTGAIIIVIEGVGLFVTV